MKSTYPMLDTLDHRFVFGQSEEKPRNEAVSGSDRVLINN